MRPSTTWSRPPSSTSIDKNILDAEGIRKITELTSTRARARPTASRTKRVKKIKKQDVEAKEAILELERQQAEAEAKQQREIETVQAREEAETAKVAPTRSASRPNRPASRADEESIAIAERIRHARGGGRGEEQASASSPSRGARRRKARDLEVVERQRETELRTIDKDKAIEVEKREIANVVRERVMVDKTVAEQEEAHQDPARRGGGRRGPGAVVIIRRGRGRGGQDQGHQAGRGRRDRRPSHKAKEEVTLADAELEAAEREAQAKIRLAEGQKAEDRRRGAGQGPGQGSRGHRHPRSMGIAEARVKEADAGATEKMGQAEAVAMASSSSPRRRASAGEGQLDERPDDCQPRPRGVPARRWTRIASWARGHRGIHQGRRGAGGDLIQEGLKNAKIDIVGGESVFFDKLVNAISSGKSVDAFVDKSHADGQSRSWGVPEGDASMRDDVKEVLTQPAFSSGDVSNLTVWRRCSRASWPGPVRASAQGQPAPSGRQQLAASTTCP